MEGGETMKLTAFATTIGAFVLLLGILGLISGEGRMMGEMNIDIVLDISRIALGGFLVYAGLQSAELSRTALMTFGIAYLGMFLVGLLDPTLLGLAPSGLGTIDQILHLGGGIAGVTLPYLIHEHKREGALI